MALQKVGEKALIAVESVQSSSKPTTKPKKVLEEDEFVEGIERIIERDFFPDLGKLRAQSEYLDALRTNDVDKLREIHIKYNQQKLSTNSDTPAIYSTPASFETPMGSTINTPLPRTHDDVPIPSARDTSSKEDEKSKIDKMSLSKYLNQYTSEDNESFEEILKENEEKRRQKHAWLYVKDGEQKELEEKYLALPGIEEQAAIEGNRTKLDTWKYKADNALMYVPEGVPLSQEELLTKAKKKPQTITHSKTRLDKNDINYNLKPITQAKAAVAAGRVGPDGKEIACDSPKINGYSFLSTPTPVPGVDDSPFMTWGEIEGTPFDLTRTPVTRTPGPIFKIPDIPRRDQVGHALADEVHKALREKKKKAMESVKRLTSPMTSKSRLTSDRLSSLSPAAQRLANAKFGMASPRVDKALRSGYTPSPSLKSKDGTPIVTHSRKSSRTPNKRLAKTPSAPEGGDISSITDNLLNLPKRPKASDFF